MQTTSVRVSAATHDEFKRPAAKLDTTIGITVALSVRALRQDHMGRKRSADLRQDEAAWLGAVPK